jgi:2-oxoglutarate ferredoxin oxidoreductase subunit alpha
VQIELITRLSEKILQHVEEIVEVERFMLDDADIAIVAYGTPSRSARRAIKDARAEGIRVGMLRLKSVWPFPEEIISELASQVKHIIIPEQNMGQVYYMLRAFGAPTPIHLMAKPAGTPQLPDEILRKIREVHSQ